MGKGGASQPRGGSKWRPGVRKLRKPWTARCTEAKRSELPEKSDAVHFYYILHQNRDGRFRAHQIFANLAGGPQPRAPCRRTVETASTLRPLRARGARKVQSTREKLNVRRRILNVEQFQLLRDRRRGLHMSRDDTHDLSNRRGGFQRMRAEKIPLFAWQGRAARRHEDANVYECPLLADRKKRYYVG